MRRFVIYLSIASLVAIIGALALPSSTYAHERRTVGNYVFIVGFLEEPAFAYSPNSIDLRVQNATTGENIEGLERTLQAEVIVGGGTQKRPLPLETIFRDPGHYQSWFIPTLPGDYTFRIFGDVQGQRVDETFTSGPGRFDAVEDPAELQFPRQLPTTADLQGSINQLSNQIANLDSGDGNSNTAMILAIIALAVGVVGAGAGIYALTRQYR